MAADVLPGYLCGEGGDLYNFLKFNYQKESEQEIDG